MKYLNFEKLECDKDHPLDIILFVLQLISLGLSTAITILSRHITFDGEISRNISEELIDNFITGYYTEFSKVSSPNIFESELLEETNDNKIIFGVWEGTKRGCGKDKVAKVLEEGKECKKDEENIYDIPKQYITKYKGISLIGISKQSYYELLYDGSIIKKNENCESGIMVGYIDTLKNKLCLDSKLPRPISYVSIRTIEPTGISNLKTISGTDINFYYSNDPYPDNENEIPFIINSFKIGDYDTMCPLPNLYYYDYAFHPLDAYKKDYADKCNLLYDYKQKYTKDTIRYHPLDSIEMYNLYEENGIIDIIQKSKVAEYGYDVDVFKNRNLKIYARMHFGFDKDCLDKRKTKLNTDTLGLIYGRADNMITWGNYILIIISTLVASASDMATFTTAVFIELVIKYAAIIGPSIGLMIYTFIARRFDDPFEEEMDCSDSITNDNYNIMIARIMKGGNKILATSILLLILVFVNIISLIIRIIIQHKKNN